MVKFISLFGLVAFLISCSFQGNGIKYTIANETSQQIRNIKFYTSEELEVSTISFIDSHEKSSGFLSMDQNESDGMYILEFEKEEKLIRFPSGYYTNGSALNRTVEFNILPDTIIVNYDKAGF